MEINKKILHIGLFLIGISLIFTIVFASVYKLENPIVIKMFIEKNIYPNEVNENSALADGFELKYITNISDNRKIVNIKFKEKPDIEVTVSADSLGYGDMPFFNDINKQSKNKYGIYVVNTIYISMNLKNIDKKFNEIELNNVKVTFNDGSTLNANLGRIILHKDESNFKDIDHIGSSGSSDGEFSSEKRLKKNIKLLKVDTPLLDCIKDCFNISIDSIDYKNISGTKHEKDKVLSIYSKFKTPKSIFEKYSYYDINPKLYYEDDKGNRSYTPIDHISHTPDNFHFIGIFKYLKLRGVI
ncbi:TPA: hypothetical protein PTV43_002993 [Clostridium botulinum]|uniref:hypothetical protein n=1 Tax=Clostridium sporogenes TaxID=1509 RepID=UPI0013D6F56E|nr:hypothetical protein [Clostridium sporogenes]NFG70118.1 hypothetical protein [Clostridium sporogenes]HDK7157823.1 hypothetical protein [Clostridium botulinum]